MIIIFLILRGSCKHRHHHHHRTHAKNCKHAKPNSKPNLKQEDNSSKSKQCDSRANNSNTKAFLMDGIIAKGEYYHSPI